MGSGNRDAAWDARAFPVMAESGDLEMSARAKREAVMAASNRRMDEEKGLEPYLQAFSH